VILCRKAAENEVTDLIRRIQERIAKTPYTSSIGYHYAGTGKKSISDMLKKSDEHMYAEKAKYYSDARMDRRRRRQEDRGNNF
jgi:hypothetical protein